MQRNYLLIVVVLALTAFTTGDNNQAGIDLASMDKSVSPREDFYQYANGTWVKNNPVPPDEPRWGSFDMLRQDNLSKLKGIFMEIAANQEAPAGTPEQKIRDYYLTAMDTINIEKQGMTPLQPLFERVNKIASIDDIIDVSAYLNQNGFPMAFSFFVTSDLRKSDSNICYAGQGGIHLPDRDYYLKDDDKSKKIRDEYKLHIERMFTLAGTKGGDVKAKTIIKIETELAKASKPRTELRNPEKNYNKMPLEQLQAHSFNFKWKKFLDAVGATGVKEIVIRQPDFINRFDVMLAEIPLDEWKAYFTWHVLTSGAGFLSSEFVKEDFNFYKTVLNGQNEMRPRWKEVIESADGNLGEMIGQVYVKKYFSQSSKDRVQQLVRNLLEVYKQRINQLDWMSAETKTKALDKLSKFNTKLGYPDKWKDYTALEIKRDSYLQNYMRCSNFGYKKMIDKLNKPVDKTEWGMQAHTVNAYYSPVLNEIVFPAGIMQPPFFYAEADDAVNYGAIGAVIGHEITHGFDDQGSKYDGNGNLNNWWTEEDRTKFNAKTKLLIEQFNKYEALPGVFVNGELTLGENIADLGGLSVAYQAYQLSLKGKKGPVINELTAEQRFFLSFAQVWKGNFKEEYLRKMVMTNVHAPGPFRASGTVSNMTEFYGAFGVKPGDKMYRDEKVRPRIW